MTSLPHSVFISYFIQPLTEQRRNSYIFHWYKKQFKGGKGILQEMVFRNKMHFELKIIQSVFLVASGILEEPVGTILFFTAGFLRYSNGPHRGNSLPPNIHGTCSIFIQKSQYIVMHSVNISES